MSHAQKQVLEIIRSYPGKTNNEIALLLRLPINRITGRTNELVKMRIVEDAGKKSDPFTGKTAHIWVAKRAPLPEAFPVSVEHRDLPGNLFAN